ncbi:hypothetical protein ACOMHN_049621 [Nucella lapillus]
MPSDVSSPGLSLTSDSDPNLTHSIHGSSIPTDTEIGMTSSPKHKHNTSPKTGRGKNLRILNINFQSARKKGKHLEALIDSTDPDIIIGTETWLDDEALPSVGNSDHDVVLYNTSLRPFRPKPPKRNILLWKKANVHAIRKHMEEYAQTFDIDTSKPDALETAWRGFSERVQKTIDKNVPSYDLRPRRAATATPGLTPLCAEQ